MIWTDICQRCGHEEDDIRTVAKKYDTTSDPCPVCKAVDWKVQEIYLPQRCYGLKGEMENFPLQSHMKDNNGNRIVFENKKSYETYLSDRGLAIAGNREIGTQPDPVVKPSKALESHPAFKKMKDMEEKGLIDTKPKFIPNEEVENEL
jgi:hypothetical protein